MSIWNMIYRIMLLHKIVPALIVDFRISINSLQRPLTSRVMQSEMCATLK